MSSIQDIYNFFLSSCPTNILFLLYTELASPYTEKISNTAPQFLKGGAMLLIFLYVPISFSKHTEIYYFLDVSGELNQQFFHVPPHFRNFMENGHFFSKFSICPVSAIFTNFFEILPYAFIHKNTGYPRH